MVCGCDAVVWQTVVDRFFLIAVFDCESCRQTQKSHTSEMRHQNKKTKSFLRASHRARGRENRIDVCDVQMLHAHTIEKPFDMANGILSHIQWSVAESTTVCLNSCSNTYSHRRQYDVQWKRIILYHTHTHTHAHPKPLYWRLIWPHTATVNIIEQIYTYNNVTESLLSTITQSPKQLCDWRKRARKKKQEKESTHEEKAKWKMKIFHW